MKKRILLLTTGGTFLAMNDLVIKAGGKPVGALAVIRLEELEGEKKIPVPTKSLLNLSDCHE